MGVVLYFVVFFYETPAAEKVGWRTYRFLFEKLGRWPTLAGGALSEGHCMELKIKHTWRIII